MNPEAGGQARDLTGRPATGENRPKHSPIRPLWLCRACGHPWPCGRARLDLLTEYAHDHLALAIYLSTSLWDATRDLCELNPHEMRMVSLWDRFLGWLRQDQSG